MNNFPTIASCVSIFDSQEVAWLSWKACSYTDSIAVFKFMVTDSVIATIPTNSLQPDEIERANRYHRPADRNRFLYGRHLLRVLLAQYTNQFPSKIDFTSNKNRKPEIKDNIDWHFNVSHSGDWVLIGVARNFVGVDVETIDPIFSIQAILSTSFTAIEQQFIQEHPDPATTFYQLWTRKEALVKATGKGLDDDFPNIPSLLGSHQLEGHGFGASENWLVQSFMVTPGYPAAVAYPIGLEMPKFYTVDGGFFADFTS